MTLENRALSSYLHFSTLKLTLIDVCMLSIENFVRKKRGYSDDNFRNKKEQQKQKTQE